MQILIVAVVLGAVALWVVRVSVAPERSERAPLPERASAHLRSGGRGAARGLRGAGAAGRALVRQVGRAVAAVGNLRRLPIRRAGPEPPEAATEASGEGAGYRGRHRARIRFAEALALTGAGPGPATGEGLFAHDAPVYRPERRRIGLVRLVLTLLILGALVAVVLVAITMGILTLTG